MVKGRSIGAILVEKMIRLTNKKVGVIDEEMMDDFLRKKAIKNSKEYHLSGRKKNEQEERYGLLKLYTFNSEIKEGKTIYYIPGGGYVYPPNRHEIKMIREIAKRVHYRIIMVVYPLIPIVNVSELYTLMISYFKSQNVEDFSFIGDSAGGGLALGLAMKMRELKLKQPQELFLLSPWLDVNMSNKECHSYEKKDAMLEISKLKAIGRVWSKGLSKKDYMVSPLYGDYEGLGKIYLYIGNREVFYPDVIKLVNKLRKKRIEHELIIGENMGHVWLSYPIKEAKKDRNELIEKIVSRS